MQVLNKTKILYLEESKEGVIGGSHFSLYFLLTNLDKNKFSPSVALYEQSDMATKYERLAEQVFILSPPKKLHISNRLLIKSFRYIISLIRIFHDVLIPAFKRSRWLKKNHFDIVHLNNSPLLSLEWIIACRLTGIPCVAHMRGYRTNIPKSSQYIGRLVAKTICVSHSIKQAMITCGLSPKRLTVIHNAIDLPSPNDLIFSNQRPWLEKITPNDPVVGIVGNIKHWKGQHILIQAMASVIKTHPNCKCLIVGNHSENSNIYFNSLKESILKLGLEKNVIFTGYEKQPIAAMNCMDIVVHASIEPEPFGRVVIEAMAIQKPVIGANDGGVPEIITDNETGFLYPPGDSEKLAQHIHYLLSSPNTCLTFGQNGYQRVISEFSTKQNVLKTQLIYQELV